jgi:hypothetical protein
MTYKRLFLLLILILPAFSIVFSGESCGKVIAPAGSTLESRSELYFSGEHQVPAPILINVPQIYGLLIKPSEVKIRARSGKVVFIPCELYNLGNGTDKVTLQFDTGKTTLELKLLVDENKDSVHQLSENKAVPRSIVLGEGAAYGFFVVATVPADAKAGTWAWGALTATSQKEDGPLYIGDNGVHYGGSDRVVMNISVYVE